MGSNLIANLFTIKQITNKRNKRRTKYTDLKQDSSTTKPLTPVDTDFNRSGTSISP